MKWDSIETFFLDMDGTLLDLAYDNYFWHKHIPKVYAKKNNISYIKSKKIFEEMYKKTKVFFKKNGLLLNWSEFEKLDQDQKINTLAMIAPISNEEKQTILESVHIDSKTRVLSEIVEFYLYEKSINNITLQ